MYTDDIQLYKSFKRQEWLWIVDDFNLFGKTCRELRRVDSVRDLRFVLDSSFRFSEQMGRYIRN